MNAALARYAPWMLGILRIVTALVYMEHGTMKLFHFPPQMRFGGGGAGGGPGRSAANAVQQGADAASSAVSSAIDAASTAMSSAVDAVSSMAASAPPPTGGPGAPDGMPSSMQTIFLIGGLIEFIGGLALVFGLFTRPIAFIVAGECAVIFWWMHVGRSGNIFPATNGGEAVVLFCFTFLYLVFAGPGAFAVDGVLARRKPA
jgi:putative oxidoreductase